MKQKGIMNPFGKSQTSILSKLSAERCKVSERRSRGSLPGRAPGVGFTVLASK